MGVFDSVASGAKSVYNGTKSVINKGFNFVASGAASVAARAVMPDFEEQVEVTVYGNRTSKRKDLYRLALALAFGKVAPQNFFKNFIPPGMIAMTYDCMEKVVKVIVHYRYIASTNVAGGFNGATAAIFQGPEDVCRGGAWSFNSISLNTATGIPGESGPSGVSLNAVIGAANQKVSNQTGGNTRITLGSLVDKEIITNKPVDNPAPPFDNGTRGTYIERLVYQFLTGSCVDPLPTTTTADFAAKDQAQRMYKVMPASDLKILGVTPGQGG